MDEDKRENGREFLKGILWGAGAALLVCVGIYIGMQIRPYAGKSELMDNSAYVQKLGYLEELIQRYYLEETDEEQLAEGIYKGLLYGLEDPYSRYYTAEEYEAASMDTEGQYVGIGISMSLVKGKGALVERCYEGAPGEQAGLQAGDVIVKIDGEDLSDKTIEEISHMVKEATDSVVVLTIQRGEIEELQELSVPVKDVELSTVEASMLQDGIGYLTISEFKGVTPKQYEKAYKELLDQGMERMIVDLRDNPGGLLSSVCDVLAWVLPEGVIVYTEDKYGERNEKLCEGEHPLEMPLVVLINGESASAAEIFAGAVKDYGIGRLVGTTTYGKGVVQTVTELTDGSAVKLTISQYFTPLGNTIHEIGVSPDVEIQNEEESEEDLQLQAAIQEVKKILR